MFRVAARDVVRSAQQSQQWSTLRVQRAMASKVNEVVANEVVQTKKKKDTVDGCTAVTHVAYGMSDTAFIFPITPSSPLAELAEQWSALGVKNAFGDTCKVTQMQSEAGAAGALHGALCTGSLATTFTASQGLLLMIPNMYKIAGELLPCVIHVAARALASQGLSIFGDHQDIMAARQTGFAILGGATVQESHDMALASHLTTLNCRVPFVNYFDGFRVSHVIEKVDLMEYNRIRTMIDHAKLTEFHQRALSPMHPHMRGTNQNPDIYMQLLEASNPFYDRVPEALNETFAKIAKETGRQYKIMEYAGAPDAEEVVVIMGSGFPVFQEALEFLAQRGDKVGLVMPRLFRPWSGKDFLDALPKTTKRIAVMDRTKEPGSLGEPLFLDVAATIQMDPAYRHIDITKGRYGLGQKEFTPGMAITVIDHMKNARPGQTFTVGIEDDIGGLSLPVNVFEPDVMPKGTVQSLIYGFGSDGTVGANKNAIKIIGDNTDRYVQGYFAYGASKAGGLTLSHLRFGPEPIHSYYGVTNADYVGCHNPIYVDMYEMANELKVGGTFCLNSSWTTIEEMDKHIPGSLRKMLYDKKANFYNIDAFKVAQDIGMGRMINTVMQACFFQISGVLPYEQAIELFKNAIKKSYSAKGENVVKKNWAMVDAAVGNLKKIEMPAYWGELEAGQKLAVEKKLGASTNPDFVRDILTPMSLLQGDKIPVSTFEAGGAVPMGTSQYEKRAVAMEAPEVDMNKCTQCNYCSMSCPHAVIRPFLLSQEEFDRKPISFDARKARGGAEVAGLNFRIQVSAADCTGCAVCVNTCPDNSLTMTPLPQLMAAGNKENWDFAMSLPDRGHRFEKSAVKGAQFQTPLLEFHGACAGCGETPYAKLLTQLFGERMIIANATGCSSIWSGPFGSNPYTTRKEGRGVAWGNSLFEDAAEYGLGMVVTMATRRKGLRSRVNELLLDGADAPVSKELYAQLREWAENYDNWKVCNRLSMTLPPLLEKEAGNDTLVNEIHTMADLFPKFSMWTIGGDGWAYDIGFGGLDHVLASGQNVNVLILDTEVYSNTGGQSSKSTPMGAIAKFAQNGRETQKKDLCEMAMSYGNVYVANVSMGANMQQTLKAFMEAEAHNGPSLLMAYSPCIEHKNIDGMANTMQHMANAANSGYFPLFRYVPSLKDAGKNPFLLDTKKLTVDVNVVMTQENRFAALKRADPERYEQCSTALREHVLNRFKAMQERAQGGQVEQTGIPLTLLYGSETGTTEELAYRTAEQARARGYAVNVMELDEMDVDELPAHKNVLVMCSTCGEGDFPKNAAGFFEQISKPEAYPENHLAGTNFAVFGLGDSSYHEFNLAAKEIDAHMARLGATRMQEVGLGNDQDEDKYDTAFEEWLPSYWTVTNSPEPEGEHLIKPAAFDVMKLDPEESMEAPYVRVTPPHSLLLNVVKNDRLTPADFDRAIQHVVFDLKNDDLPYLLGDVLNVFPSNDPTRVQNFLEWYGLEADEHVKVVPLGTTDARRESAYRRPMTQRQIFEEVVDILGRPGKFFYRQLAKFATEESEKKQLELLASDEGKDEYSKLIEETVTYDDVLRMFPSAKPPVEQLLTLIPCIKPRLYSIASSPRNDRTLCELAIVILEWTTPKGVQRRGLGTDYIARIKAGDLVPATVTSGTFNFPTDPMTPMVMAGLGTGLAPFRAFAQERNWVREQGIKTGPMWLFYGCRYKAKDYIFGEELEKYAANGTLTQLHPAFSRDQKEKIYVQTRINENAKELGIDLVDKKGYFYLCGQAGQVERDIKNAIYETIAAHNGTSKEEGIKAFEKMQEEGRYCPELY